MKNWKKMLVAGMLMFMVGGVTQTFAQETTDFPDPPGYENYWTSAAHKLGRGIANAAFGALEIPIKIAEVNFEEGGIAACTFGVFKGLGYFVAREVVGVVEIVTFPVPLPGTPNDPHDVGIGFGPIMEPEWIITLETNYYNFVFRDTTTR